MFDKKDLAGYDILPPRQWYEGRRIAALRDAKALREGGDSHPPLSPAEVLGARAEGRLIFYLAEASDRLDRAMSELAGAEGGVTEDVTAAFRAVRDIIDKLESPPPEDDASGQPPAKPRPKPQSKPRPKRKPKRKPREAREAPQALICPDGTEIKAGSWVATRLALVKRIQAMKPGMRSTWADLPHVRKRSDLTPSQVRSGSRGIGGNLHILLIAKADEHRSAMRKELKAFGLQAEDWGLLMPSGRQSI